MGARLGSPASSLFATLRDEMGRSRIRWRTGAWSSAY